MVEAIHDLRQAWRRWRARPAVAVSAVLTLTLAIGVTTAIFSVVDAVLLRPLPWHDSGRLAVAWIVRPEWRQNPVLASVADRGVLSWPNFRDLQSRTHTLESVGVWFATRPIVETAGIPEQIRAMHVSSTFLETLQVAPLAGRNFARYEDDDPNDAAIITYEGWQRRFGGDPRILGRQITIDEATRTIVGVLPPRFRFEGNPPELLLPIGGGDKSLRMRGNHNFHAVVRLRAGVTLEQAQADTEPVLREQASRAQRTSRLVPLAVEQLGETRRPLLILLGAAGLLLLVACANVAGLLIAEIRKRGVELAVRTALGANRSRLIRQLLVEATALAAAGAAAGILLARWLTPALVALAPERLPRLDTVAIDLRVLAFALLLGLLTATICAAGAAVTMLAEDPARALAEAGRGSVRRHRVQDAIVVFQIALALVLLAGASLFGETVRRMGAQAVGFDPSNVVVVTVRAPRSMAAGVAPAVLVARTTGIVERLAAVPGVACAAGTASAAFGGSAGSNLIEIEGRVIQPPPSARRQIVTESFFKTMRIPVLRGRAFETTDSSAAKLALVSEDFERRYMDGRALGRRFRFGGEMMEIIGVVPNTKQVDLTDEAEPTFFALWRQMPRWSLDQYVVRSAGSPDTLMAALTDAVRRYDPRLLVSTMVTMDTLIARSMAEERYRARLAAMFGATALVLCAIGVYGLFAREVTDRRREIGLRMALGARPAAVLRRILRQGLVLVAAGLALGIPAALAAGEVMRSLLFGITPGAPGVYIVIATMLVLTGLVATLIAARRAIHLDPSTLLRSE